MAVSDMGAGMPIVYLAPEKNCGEQVFTETVDNVARPHGKL